MSSAGVRGMLTSSSTLHGQRHTVQNSDSTYSGMPVLALRYDAFSFQGVEMHTDDSAFDRSTLVEMHRLKITDMHQQFYINVQYKMYLLIHPHKVPRTNNILRHKWRSYSTVLIIHLDMQDAMNSIHSLRTLYLGSNHSSKQYTFHTS